MTKNFVVPIIDLLDENYNLYTELSAYAALDAATLQMASISRSEL